MSRYLRRGSGSASTARGTTNFSNTSADVSPATMPEAEPNGLPLASAPSNAGATSARIFPEKAFGQVRCWYATDVR